MKKRQRFKNMKKLSARRWKEGPFGIGWLHNPGLDKQVSDNQKSLNALAEMIHFKIQVHGPFFEDVQFVDAPQLDQNNSR